MSRGFNLLLMMSAERPSTIDQRSPALPRLYAILDASCFPSDQALFQFAQDLLAGGVSLLQYRNKTGSSRQMLSHAR